MIIFYGTRKIGKQNFMVFTNEANSIIQIPVDDNIMSFFLHHFDHLSPVTKLVEEAEGSEEGD